MSTDAERDAAQTARCAARWRELEREALDLASAMADPEAKRNMLFASESYKLLAERAELRKELLAAVAEAKRAPTETKGPNSAIDTRGNGADEANGAK